MNTKRFLYTIILSLIGLGAWAQRVSPYVGVGYTVRSLGGITATVGATFLRHDLQLSYTFGLGKSDPVHWYDDNGIWLSTVSYKQSSLTVRYGYRFDIARTFIVTPQLGYSLSTLNGNREQGGTNYGDGAKASSMTVGAKLQYQPLPFMSVFVAPEYAIALSQDTYYKHTAEYSNYSADGISVSVGLLFTF